MTTLYDISISEKQKTRIAVALREFAAAHPEIPADDYSEWDSDNPESLAGMLDDCVTDATNNFTL